MRLLLLIDSLGSGGAQRQLAYLAVLLKRAGHEVRVLKYHPLDFFEPFVVSNGVRVDALVGLAPLARIRAVRRYIRDAHPDAVIAFLATPSLLAELASLPRRRFKLIVSERNFDIQGPGISFYRRMVFHALADWVVANSYSQTDLIRRAAPWLGRKTTTILNCVDHNVFSPAGRNKPQEQGGFRFLAIASVCPRKNPVALVRAFAILRQKRMDLSWVLDWYGDKLEVNGVPLPYSALAETTDAIQLFGLESHFRLHDPTSATADLYRHADALILPSFFEGCPNVVCEAFASGVPVLASRVGDIPRLVEDGVNGLLFNPHSPDDISSAIERFCDLPADKRAEMGRTNRRKAETLFSFDRFLNEYQQLLLTGPGS